MMNNEEQRPIRAGRAYQEVLQGDRAAQNAWMRVQAQLRVFGELMRLALEPTVAARAAVTKHAASLLHPYRDLGEALGTALSGDFERLRALVDAYPTLRQAADELEQAVQELHRRDSAESDALAQRLQDALASSRELIGAHPPNLDDPAFWSGIVPIGEQIRDAVRAVMREQGSPSRDSVGVADVIAQLERYRVAGGPYLDQRTFAQFCDCSTTTINKAVNQNVSLRQWKDGALRVRKQKAALRRDPGNFDLVIEQVAAEPVEPVLAEDVDTLLHQLRQQAATNPEWLQRINAMPADRQTELARLYASSDYEPSPLEEDPPGRPRKTRYHGRV